MSNLGRFVAAMALALAACSPAKVPVAQAVASGKNRPAHSDDSTSAGPSRQYYARNSALILTIPDGKDWHLSESTSGSILAKQVRTSSTLSVRLFREGNQMNRSACEQALSPITDVKIKNNASILEQRRIDVPHGFDTVMTIGLARKKGNGPQEGFVYAVGGWARQCFVYLYTTRAEGIDHEQAISERLAAMVSGSLERVQLADKMSPYRSEGEPGKAR